MSSARTPLILCLLLACSALACDRLGPGVAALEDGDAAAAAQEFREALTDASDGERDELRYALALAEFRDGALDRAAETAEGIESPELFARQAFLRGGIAAARAEVALAQAQAVQSEPFAFELAVRRGERAVEHFTEAVVAHGDWPAAARNLERTSRRLVEIRRLRDEAGGGVRRTSGGPQIRLHPTSGEERTADATKSDRPDDGPGAGEDGTDEGPETAADGEELSRAEVLGVLERLSEKEREKRRLRAETRSAQRRAGERDW